jgi:hypothetical protein
LYRLKADTCEMDHNAFGIPCVEKRFQRDRARPSTVPSLFMDTGGFLKRDLGALSSVMNFAVLHEWKKINPVLPWLKSVKERRDPIVLPTDEDIALVTKMAPGNWPHLIQAALVTGAREDELVSAKRVQRDLERQTLRSLENATSAEQSI